MLLSTAGSCQTAARRDNAAPAAASQPQINLPKATGDAVVVSFSGAGGLTLEDAARLLKVRVVDASAPEQTRAPIQGRYTLRPGSIRFTPLFPFVTEQTYRVEWRSPDASAAPPAIVSFRLAGAGRESPRVMEIAPSASVIPANTLRFYITFSRSLREAFDRRTLRITDDAGQDVAGAFMSFGQELWSADGKRLTLLCDPGRIKRGVTAHLTEGSPLAPGRHYTLSISLPAAPKFAEKFQVSGPLRTPLTLKRWRLTPPQAGRAPRLSCALIG